jgi:hypothetical protein
MDINKVFLKIRLLSQKEIGGDNQDEDEYVAK